MPLFAGVLHGATGRVQITDGVAAPSFFSNGVGFESDGSVATRNAGTISVRNNGIGFTAEGRVCTTTTTTGSQVVQGVRVSDTGLLIIEAAVPTQGVNGNPLTATGALAVE